MFMHNHKDTIKDIKFDNKKVEFVVKVINEKGVKLQEEVQEAKQLRMQLCNYLITEF